MAMTIQKDPGYFNHKKQIGTNYVRFRNSGTAESAYDLFSKDNKDAFGASLTEIKDWQESTGGCALHTVKKADKK